MSEDMVEKNPAVASSYLYLLDNLLADSRIAEAQDILSTYEKLPDHKPFLIYDYKAKIYDLLGKAKEVQHLRGAGE